MIVLGENALLVVNVGAVDVSVAVAGVAVPALVTSEPVVLVNTPLVVADTLTVIVHPPAGTEVPEATLTPVLVTVTPVQVPALVDDVMLTFVGIVSVNAELNVYAPVFVLPRVIVSTDVVEPVTDAGANDFVSVGKMLYSATISPLPPALYNPPAPTPVT
jgi:hypothetical protein